MASMMALPHQGHLQIFFYMFAFVKLKHNGSMVVDPTEPDIDASQFVREDQSANIYGDEKEDLHTSVPEPRRVAFTVRGFIDSDHDGDMTTRRSRTG